MLVFMRGHFLDAKRPFGDADGGVSIRLIKMSKKIRGPDKSVTRQPQRASGDRP